MCVNLPGPQKLLPFAVIGDCQAHEIGLPGRESTAVNPPAPEVTSLVAGPMARRRVARAMTVRVPAYLGALEQHDRRPVLHGADPRVTRILVSKRACAQTAICRSTHPRGPSRRDHFRPTNTALDPRMLTTFHFYTTPLTATNQIAELPLILLRKLRNFSSTLLYTDTRPVNRVRFRTTAHYTSMHQNF